jgi:hypothetical protein
VRTAPVGPALERTNFRGRTVTLAAGPALAVGAATAAALGAPGPASGAAALVAGVGAGAVGLYDDVVGARPEQKAAKGFSGHLTALREGMITAGTVKSPGWSAPARRGRPARRRPHRRRAPPPPAAGPGPRRSTCSRRRVVAGTANLLNLPTCARSGPQVRPAARRPADAGPHGGLAAGAVGAAAAGLPRGPRRAGDGRRQRRQRLGAVLGVSLAARRAGRAPPS